MINTRLVLMQSVYTIFPNFAKERKYTMESKLNWRQINEYSGDFTKSVMGSYFNSKDAITGKDILNLCKPHQINLFVLKDLFFQWEAEEDKLKSKYFDYEHQDVKRALNMLMNILSQHIKIKEKDFAPLLTKAVEDTILIIFSPYEFYRNELHRLNKNNIDARDLKKLSKYVKINPNLLDKFIGSLNENDAVLLSDALRLLDKLVSKTEELPEDFGKYLKEFSQTAPLNIEMIYEERSGEQSEDQGSIVDDRQERQTLNDQWRGKTPVSIADAHHQKIESIRSSLTLHQKYMFIQQLFSGNEDEFHKAIEIFDNAGNYESAFSVLKQDYVRENEWDMESEEVKELLNVLDRRFR